MAPHGIVGFSLKMPSCLPLRAARAGDSGNVRRRARAAGSFFDPQKVSSGAKRPAILFGGPEFTPQSVLARENLVPVLCGGPELLRMSVVRVRSVLRHDENSFGARAWAGGENVSAERGSQSTQPRAHCSPRPLFGACLTSH